MQQDEANPKQVPTRKARARDGKVVDPQWWGQARPNQLDVTPNCRNSTTLEP